MYVFCQWFDVGNGVGGGDDVGEYGWFLEIQQGKKCFWCMEVDDVFVCEFVICGIKQDDVGWILQFEML